MLQVGIWIDRCLLVIVSCRTIKEQYRHQDLMGASRRAWKKILTD